MAQLTGTVTKDARLITTETGKKFAAFDFVENDTYKDKQGNKVKKSFYFNCTMWNADKIAPHIKKGTIMVLEGNLSAGTYTRGSGETKVSSNMSVKSIKFLGGSKKAQPEQQAAPAAAGVTMAEPVTDDLPF
jgi:single-strand DNA-binding protein